MRKHTSWYSEMMAASMMSWRPGEYMTFLFSHMIAKYIYEIAMEITSKDVHPELRAKCDVIVNRSVVQ